MNTNRFSMMNSKLFQGIAAFIILVSFGGWFYVNEQKLRKEAWTGVVTKKWEEEPWLRGLGMKDLEKQRRRTKYYWQVKRDDGVEAEVKIPMTLYVSSSEGSRVQKIYSERYPRLAK